jgi:hypothetical protein
MSAACTLTHRVRINKTLTAEMTVGPAGFTVQWVGAVPNRFTPVEQRRYRKGRDKLLRKLSAQMGWRILVVET